MQPLCNLIFGCLCLTLAVSPAVGYEVQPMIQKVDVSSGSGYSSIQIRNTSDQALPIDISAFRMELHNGSPRTGRAADDDLLVFPPSVVIPPASTQVVRIQWLPDSIQNTDTSYIVLVEQLPNRATSEGVQMLLAFNAIVHVHVPYASPALVVAKSTIRFDELEPVLQVELHNTGTGNAYGHEISLQLKWESGIRTIAAGELSRYVADLFLPPDYRRTIEIPMPEIDADSTVEIAVRTSND